MILVVGSTGQLGGLIARRLLQRGDPVRIMVRETSDHAALVDAGATRVVGDLKDAESIARAVDGVETLITTANSARRTGADDVRNVDLDGNGRLIEAARNAGVERFVFTSAIGSTPDSPVPFVAAKGIAEQRLRESGMHYTILAPTPYMEVWLGMVAFGPVAEGREVVYVGDGTTRHSMVSVDDVAAIAVAALDHPDGRDAYVPIAGPTAFSWRDAVASLERALGREIPQRGVSPGEPVPGLPESVQGLVTLLGTSEILVDGDDTARRYGVRLTTLDELVDKQVAAYGDTAAVGMGTLPRR